ncbi:class I SAM-dependent methyltransferase [Alienimonas chondri]|uniref:Class I SAM-dependent methyltransferase n=1 Tax=Alienimonas chondri TaxID=2681879 RepID=A0ABX1VJ40_9PLAN|nr:class I SAM-dependent methyltransferase [Alienimonas chondri]NNJ27870.1 hypothetical protein [Alienimonas chondri]
MLRSTLRHLTDQIAPIAKLRELVAGHGIYPPGHFHSPLPSEEEIAEGLRRAAAIDAATLRPNAPAGEGAGLVQTGLGGVDMNRDAQRALLEDLAAFYPEQPFPERQTEGCRYYFDQTMFCYSDAILLYAFLRHFQPRRVVEVGSGFSSAVMLDTLDRFGPQKCELTFVEPYPGRLRKLVDPEADPRVTLIESTVQRAGVTPFEQLDAGDLLFIDSSHVMKPGSDLQMLLFDVLPTLRTGTLVHVHDIFYPFEYPADWLKEGVYWNELYLLQAFLMGNRDWEIVLFNHYVNLEFPEFMEEKMPLCRKNFGGGIYLRKFG